MFKRVSVVLACAALALALAGPAAASEPTYDQGDAVAWGSRVHPSSSGKAAALAVIGGQCLLAAC